MGDIWVVTTFFLIFLLIILIIYHLYYRMNIKHITKQLVEIMNITDTNGLLTVKARQKDILQLVNILNRLIKDIRSSRIQIKRLNMKFRKGITNIAHDLRTPLTTARGYVQLLQTNVTEEEKQEYLKIVLERQNMVQILLEQLFEYVRIESGETTYENVPIDAKKVFIDTLTMYYDDFNKKGEEPIVKLLEKQCIILGDEQGLKRIFSNILFNSIIHGKGEYSFQIIEEESYIFTFSNISDPMTREDLDIIFNRFYTKDQARNKNNTGLGLTIAKEITMQFNGRIAAFYNDGKFSISVSLPKAE
ncbi:HAMP domain-containing histidine kinase [Tissierella pigra]|uniref:histidine kinase n=1 Tax=Tissierella pigra TaxID=2607614 RepID=A0A6N7XEL4_9FIRM|nr:HAMP domain-containing sensor histidine kinase [Tissierella pigra]MBU5427679.1 HAMP domain-containing histidine kinase [Tissierella pigra]MSU00429.1 HAMP domain-containing histidine kinase [Tissierella pigra]